MSGPAVDDDLLSFTLPDPHGQWRAVELSCDDAVVERRRFRRHDRAWRLVVPVPPLHRLEYRLVVTDAEGNDHVVLDPANPHAVATAFGHRSVALLPGYRAPDWLDDVRVEAARSDLAVATAVGSVPVTVWRPIGLLDDVGAPLLVVHDGPEYDRLARLGDWAAAAVARGTLPPMRMALLQPVHRDEWYAANPDWPDAVRSVVATVGATWSVTGPIATMGASLGGLAALQVALSPHPHGAHPIRAVFAQSGSFFTPALDPQEAGYPHFDRVASQVARMDDLARHAPRLRVAMTCGEKEENHANNQRMAAALSAAGHDVTCTSVPDLHNYTAWRDALDPTLADLLAATWDPAGSTTGDGASHPNDVARRTHGTTARASR